MSADIQRALVLLQQGRYPEARQHVQRAIGEDPESPQAHALLALCLSESKEKTEAIEAAQRAIALNPDDPYPHYVMGWVRLMADEPRPALASVNEALRLDPRDPDVFALLSQTNLRMSKFAEALEAAESGLAIDGEHIECLNLRSVALTHLGRKTDAAEGVAEALARDPENATSHANAGWAAMHAGDYGAAMESFREALRLDPENDWARDGMAEAMKGGSLIYRPIHRFYLWTTRLSQGQQIALLLSFPIANRVLRGVERSNPDLAPVLEPIIYTLLVFVYLTWVAEPAANFVLLLHPYGRLVLDAGTKRIAAVCGVLLLAGIVEVGAGWAIDDLSAMLGGVALLGMVIPIHGTGTLPPGTARNLLWGYTAALALVGMLMLASPIAFPAYVLGVVVYTWIRAGISAGHRAGL